MKGKFAEEVIIVPDYGFWDAVRKCCGLSQ